MALMVFIGAAAWVAAKGPAGEESIDRSPAAIARAVADLGNEDAAVRDRASELLYRIGEPAKQGLKAAAESGEAEVRVRAAAVLARLERPLELKLSAERKVATAESGLPRMSVTFRNSGAGPVMVMLPVDGCDVGWRAVGYEWVVKDAAGVPLERPGFGRCGNVNSLRDADFVRIEAGKTAEFRPGEMFLSDVNTAYRINRPGVYRVSLRYVFNRGRPERGLALGQPDGGVADLLRETLETELTSNEVVVELK